MKNIIKNLYVDKDIYKKVFLYNLGFFVLFFIIAEIFSKIFASISVKITSLAGIGDILALEEAAVQTTGVGNLVSFLLFAIILFILIELYNYSFFENLIWNTIFKKKTTFKNTNKFLGLNVLLGIILTALVLIMFFIISKLPDNLIKIGVAVFYLAVLFAFYLLYVGYISFGKTHEIVRSLKNAFNIGVKRLDLTIMPLVIATVISAVINLILLLFTWLPEIGFLILQGIVLAAYVAWFRMYLANALKSVKF